MDQQAFRMIFNGFIKTDLVNYPGKVAAAVFTGGCNFRCPYCHNPQLVNRTSMEEYPESVVLNYLNSNRIYIDGLVVSGGEPTLQSELPAFLKKVKDMGYSVKLDTNGSNPDALEHILANSLADYVAMDLKAPLGKYRLMGFTDTNKIRKSMEILRNSSIPYEFRTTCPRELLSPSDIREVGKLIQINEIWHLNPFNPRITLDPSCNRYTSYTETELAEFITLSRN